MLAIVDHYEPFNGNVGQAQADARVRMWTEAYPTMTEGLHDADGRPPQHTFFYPAEQYDANHTEALAELVQRGFGEVEVHLHHDDDTSVNLRRSLLEFTANLRRRHGLLTHRPDGSTSYGFIHGNWALDNSREDGRFCGVNDEISILIETGCYADFTMPAAPDRSQTRTVNSIYYAVDDPNRAKSHDSGIRAAVGRPSPANSLLMIQGPLCLDWSRRSAYVLPGVDAGTLDASWGNSARPDRFDLWTDASVTVEGRADWIFVKVHTHGAPEQNADMLLGERMRAFHAAVLNKSRDQDFVLHYVTAREMANIVFAAEHGESGNPSDFRDYVLPPPACSRAQHRHLRVC